MKKFLLTSSLLLGSVHVLMASAELDFILPNRSSGQTGTVSLASNGILTGSNIKINELDSQGTLKDGRYLSNAVLNFTSGALVSNTAVGNGALASSTNVGGTIVWDSGGSFTLVGTVTNGIDNANCCAAPVSVVLATGSFDSLQFDTFSGSLSTLGGLGVDTKNAGFVSFFGFDPLQTAWNFNLSMNDTQMLYQDQNGNQVKKGAAVKTFTGNVNGGNFGNQTETDPVPEPTTIVLFSAGLLAVSAVARRRLQHKA